MFKAMNLDDTKSNNINQIVETEKVNASLLDLVRPDILRPFMQPVQI